MKEKFLCNFFLAFSIPAWVGLQSAMAAPAPPGAGFYTVNTQVMSQGTTCPNAQFVWTFTQLYYGSSAEIFGYNAQAGYVAVVQFNMTNSANLNISGTDTWNFYPSGTGLASVSGPFSFILTLVDSNSFLMDGTYTVPNGPNQTACVAHISSTLVRTGAP